MQALAHTGEPNADGRDVDQMSASLRRFHQGDGHSLSVVSDRQRDNRSDLGRYALLQGEMHLGGFGMSVDIGQRFLRDAKQSCLDIARQTTYAGRKVELNGDFRSLGKAFAEPAQCRWQAGLVEHRRMQKIGYGANLTLALLDQGAALLERRPGHSLQLR